MIDKRKCVHPDFMLNKWGFYFVGFSNH
jgi:hypothetical protein